MVMVSFRRLGRDRTCKEKDSYGYEPQHYDGELRTRPPGTISGMVRRYV